MKSFSLVLPCYNESASLRALVAQVLRCVSRRGLTPADFQLILVDNGSVDDSAVVMAAIMREPGAEFIRPVSVAVNQGYGYGLFEGLKTTRPGVVAWTHADGQSDPEDAFIGWERLRAVERRCLVKGARHGRSRGSWLFSRCFDLAALIILGYRIHEINAQPKVFDSQLLDFVTAPPRDFAFDLYVLAKAIENGFAIEEIPVFFPPPKAREVELVGDILL